MSTDNRRRIARFPDRERQLAKWRAIQRDPATAPLMRMAALREINKLMGLRPQQ